MKGIIEINKEKIEEGKLLLNKHLFKMKNHFTLKNYLKVHLLSFDNTLFFFLVTLCTSNLS